MIGMYSDSHMIDMTYLGNFCQITAGLWLIPEPLSEIRKTR